MKIAVAQTRPIAGNVDLNIAGHLDLIDVAVSLEADVVIFPELSLTGYEPTLSAELAMAEDYPCLEVFQDVGDTHNVTIGVGVPTKKRNGVCISMAVIRPRKGRFFYSKVHLHSSEEPYFVRGPETAGLIGEKANVALAICYELSVPQHAAKAFANGADIYIASVVEPVDGIEKALTRLSEIAHEYSMTVLMSNCVGQSGGWMCAGRSSVWNRNGELLAQLDDASEGVIVIDTQSQDVVKRSIDPVDNDKTLSRVILRR